MRTLLLTVTMLVTALASHSQEIVKLYPDDTMTDSIVYRNNTSVLVINRVDLVNHMTGLDTTLQKTCYSDNKVFRNVQFSHLSPQEIESHFTSALAVLADSTHNNLEFNTNKITQFWTEDEGILLPYVEDLLSSLLTDGRIKVIDKSTQKAVPQYTIFWEDIDGQPFKIYKLPTGKIIFRESDYYLEHFAGTGAAR